VKSEYVIEGRIKNTNESGYNNGEQLYFPKEFKAVMYKLSDHNVDIKSAKQYDRRNSSNDKHFSYVINDTENIKLTDDIWIVQENTTQKSNDIKVEIEIYVIKVFSYTISFNELNAEIRKWVEEYDDFLWKMNDDKIYFYSYQGSFGTMPYENITFERAPFASNKTFGNIFFDKKRELMQRLDYFMTQSE
jgi:hypothetical protein